VEEIRTCSNSFPSDASDGCCCCAEKEPGEAAEGDAIPDEAVVPVTAVEDEEEAGVVDLQGQDIATLSTTCYLNNFVKF
jgi:hypothetical protein